MKYCLFLLFFSLNNFAGHVATPAPKAAPRAVTPAPKTAPRAVTPAPKTAPRAVTPPPATAKSQAARQSSAALQKIATLVQRYYDKTNSATFDFEQSYYLPSIFDDKKAKTSVPLAVKEKSTGKVSYDKAKGSMMWHYSTPRERKLYINGNKLTYYSPADKAAYINNCYDKDTLSASVTFLLGQGKLNDAFTIAAFNDSLGDKKLSWISLIPKEKNPPVKLISLGTSSDGKVLESIVEDSVGGKTHNKFLNLVLNPKIDPEVFVFEAPKGVVVQSMDNIQCPQKAKAATPAKAPAPAPKAATPAKAPVPAPKAATPAKAPAPAPKAATPAKAPAAPAPNSKSNTPSNREKSQ